MLGAVIGDIAGSRFEFRNRKSKDFQLFHRKCRVTDDSVMTMAVAEALMQAVDTGILGSAAEAAEGGASKEDTLEGLLISHMQRLGRRYPDVGYGRRFYAWIFEERPLPYNSWGNGSAMRVSPCGEIARSLGEAAYLARVSASVTHDHPEGIKGAEAVATAVFLARNGKSREELRQHIERYYYPLDFTLDQIRNGFRFDVSCQGSVPQALEAFFESESLEDAVRNAVSIGGDSDTIAAIAGSVAESFYGLDEDLAGEAMEYLDPFQQDIVTRWYTRTA